MQGNPPLYEENSLWGSALSVVSQKWIPFPTALFLVHRRCPWGFARNPPFNGTGLLCPHVQAYPGGSRRFLQLAFMVAIWSHHYSRAHTLSIHIIRLRALCLKIQNTSFMCQPLNIQFVLVLPAESQTQHNSRNLGVPENWWSPTNGFGFHFALGVSLQHDTFHAHEQSRIADSSAKHRVGEKLGKHPQGKDGKLTCTQRRRASRKKTSYLCMSAISAMVKALGTLTYLIILRRCRTYMADIVDHGRLSQHQTTPLSRTPSPPPPPPPPPRVFKIKASLVAKCLTKRASIQWPRLHKHKVC